MFEAKCEGVGGRWWDTNLFCHIVPVLSRVNACVLRGSPGSGIDGSAAVPRAREGLPVNKKRDRILGLGNAVIRFSCCDARSGTGHDSSWNRLSLEDPAGYVDVV